jgi:ubiquitin C-terminal hydrolase
MNSIIQCLCATPYLVKYFESNAYRADLNRNNPLGSGGLLAEEFYILVMALWRGSYRSVSPFDFKNVISQVAPYFAGTEQQDCQEFLVYLLDGLHEDLNRVRQIIYYSSVIDWKYIKLLLYKCLIHTIMSRNCTFNF